MIIGRFETSPTAPDLVQWFRRARQTQLTDADHMFPMNEPQLMIDLVKQHLNESIRSHL
jgi:hypothetical protein